MGQKRKQQRKKLNLRTELRIVYLTSDETKFLSKDMAEDCQMRTDNKKLNEELNMIEQLSTVLESVLKKNNWGIYYKSSPLANLPVEGGAPMYKVNDVSYESLIDALRKEIVSIEESDDTQG